MDNLFTLAACIAFAAAGYILGRWHGAELAERNAQDAADDPGPDVQVRGGGGRPPVKR